MIQIAQYQAQHADGVIGVILPIQLSEFEIPVSLATQPDLLNISSHYQHGIGNFWVAVAGDEVVGTAALLDLGQQQGALRKMFVKSAYRGAEHGVGKRLLETVVDWCEDKLVREIYLGTTARFLAAHRIYEKNGFVEISSQELPATFPVMVVDTKFYRRIL